MVLDAGTRLGEYEIERLLGVGSMGAVYEGVCTATGQRYAIKVLNPALAALPSARARFLNEAKLTARVRHPHIVDVSDVGEDGGRSFFVMELLSGEDLAKRLQRSGPLSVVETADIMVPVCDAVAEAHRRGVTHRDLKPSNIFLLVRGRRPHPVVLDFGVAKEQDGVGTATAPGTTVGQKMVFGTPYYLAPEQVVNHESAGPASDQYALGVILYECLTGHTPYRGDNIDQVFRAIAAGNPVRPIALRADIPEEMNALVLRALSADPKARYFSVAELRHALLPFSSKATGSIPTLYGRSPSSPVRSSPAEASPAEPSPASPPPANDVQATKPPSLVRTLTPEVEALDGAWFAAGEAAQESAGETAAPSPITPGRESDFEPSGATVPPVEVEHAPSGAVPRLPRRIWIGAAAGAAVVTFALVFALKGGRGERSLPTPAAALVQIEPAVAAPVPPSAAPTPPPSEVPAAAAAPVPAPREPAAPAAAAAPAPVPSEPVAPSPPAAAPVPAPTEPVAPREPPAAAAPAEEPAAPAPRERAARPEPTVAAPSPARAPATSSSRKSSGKPRVRASESVRMHNGVPLLD